MIDFNRKLSISEKINKQIDTALELERSFQPSRDYMGGSRIGAYCERALQYEITKTPVDPDKDLTGRILRIFARGHWIESVMSEWLKLAGFGLVTGPKDGGQFGFVSHDGHVKGHTDGIFVAGPEQLGPWPRLWECKGLEQKYFLALKRNKLQKEFPTYYGQCQYYMENLNLTDNPAYFCAVNMNRMEIHWEEVEYNPEYVSMLDAKAARVIMSCKAGELLPGAGQDPDFFKCKMCNWHDRCFSIK
ncbi:MAG: hypothetical protein HOJ48_01190 [Desulfobacula sp.]|jgi:hypothetical protein|nr:hypothetical protein [Desulfobacula sp.]MBT6337889.1 hypothetical protein [Desulfobacula sp.]